MLKYQRQNLGVSDLRTHILNFVLPSPDSLTVSRGRTISDGVRLSHPQGEALPPWEVVEADWLECL